MAELELSDTNQLHRAIIRISIDVQEVRPNGACTGRSTHKDLKVFALDGVDKFICIRQVNELLQEIAQKCQNSRLDMKNVNQ
jgi:hypothetical protein